MIDLLTILSSAGVSVLLSAALVFLAKNWISERIRGAIQSEYDQKLETHKAQLKAQNDTQLEQLKARLLLEHERQVQDIRREFEKEAHEHRVKFQQVFPQRHQGLVEIHKIVRTAVEACYLALRSDGDPHVPAAIDATDAMQKAIYTHEIYLPRALCEKWRKTVGKMFAALIELRDARAQRTNNWSEDRKRLATAVKGYIDTLNTMNGEIADDIREAIGVDISEKKEA